MKHLIVVAAVWLAATPANAHFNGPCMKHADFLRELETVYGEVPAALGLLPGGNVIEILVSPRTATWTVIMTAPDGVTCGIAAGEEWQETPSRPSFDPPA